MSLSSSTRILGRLGLEISPLGMGGWTIGGPFFSGEGCRYPTGKALGYGEVDDAVSTRAIQCALERGITLFDTADAYGAGRGERVLGKALKGWRADAIIASKFGNTYNEQTRELTGNNVSPDYIRTACEASLRRLQSDWIDLYQLHIGSLNEQQAHEVAQALESLCDAGLILYFGWSTDDPQCAALWKSYPHAIAIQHDLNVFSDNDELLKVCTANGFASLNRSPLAMGFLSGKFHPDSTLPDDDIRASPPDWLPYFDEGGCADLAWRKKLDDLRDILTSNGRSMTQGALAWIWARSENTIPIPGMRTEAQVTELADAISFGPLSGEQMATIATMLQSSN